MAVVLLTEVMIGEEELGVEGWACFETNLIVAPRWLSPSGLGV